MEETNHVTFTNMAVSVYRLYYAGGGGGPSPHKTNPLGKFPNFPKIDLQPRAQDGKHVGGRGRQSER